jgi:lipopolysaccharide transport system ATP-binding protein
VTQSYLAYHEERSAAESRHRRSQRGDSGLYRVSDFRLVDSVEGKDLEIAGGGDLQAELVLHSPDGRPPVALFGVMRADGTPVYGVASDYDDIAAEQLDDHHYRFRIVFNRLPLLPGSYSLRGHAMDPQGIRLCDTAELRFSVSGETREMGIIRLPHSWEPGE